MLPQTPGRRCSWSSTEQEPHLTFSLKPREEDPAGCCPPLPHPPLPLIVMASDSYLYDLSYVASQRSFSRGKVTRSCFDSSHHKGGI